MMKKITILAIIVLAIQFLTPAAFARVCKSDSIASFPVPDYTNKDPANHITCDGCTWTADKSGYVQLQAGKSNDTHPEFLVNGQHVAVQFDTGWGEPTGGIFTMLIPVAKGDEIKIFGGRGFGCYYIPVKFVVPNA